MDQEYLDQATENLKAGALVATFNFHGAQVRTVIRDRQSWFVAADVCTVLQHRNPRQSVKRLTDYERGVHYVDTPGGRQEVTVINESGLYSLIFSSRKPEAEAFRFWVTNEVLPSIRRTGTYTLPGFEQPAPILANGPEFRRIVTMVVGRRVYSYEQPTEMLMTEIEEIDGRLMAHGLSMAELYLLELEQTVAMGMSVEGTTALSALATTIRSGALIAKRWLRAREKAAEEQKANLRDKMR